MATLKFKNVYGNSECLNLQRPPNVSQEVTVFTSNVLVTLENPVAVINATNTAGNISVKFRDDSAYRVIYVPAGGELKGDVSYLGTGTTVTKVVVKGIK